MGAAFHASSGALAMPSTVQDARRGLVELMHQICSDIRADRYMLIDLTARAGEKARIVASNWIYDAIDLVGLDLIVRMAVRNPVEAQALPPTVDAELLAGYGHVDIMGIPLRTGSKRYALLLTAEAPGRLMTRAVAKVELLCGYALSMLAGKLGATSNNDPLTERERECLFWVAEGKTTEEVGVILGVSTSTANSHLTSSIQKLGARNRALAIATAIRHGLI
ncbi:helix-turn-helix domain-containing protein [Tianweitania aestuarii]|nr:helix-turn-helix transcriptional regulator [Tianweitania aestuarii]